MITDIGYLALEKESLDCGTCALQTRALEWVDLEIRTHFVEKIGKKAVVIAHAHFRAFFVNFDCFRWLSQLKCAI
jgi:hypothetical protein